MAVEWIGPLNNRSFYDGLFSTGGHKPWRDAPGKVVVLGYVLSKLQGGERVLDVGCGDGYFLNRLVSETAQRMRAISGLGIDISGNAIDLASSEYPELMFQVMDAESLDFEGDRFEWITSYGVFEHLPSPGEAINEMARVLVPHGRFALMMPTLGYYRTDRTDEGWYEDKNDPPQMQWHYPRDKWEKLFGASGLILEPTELASDFGAINAGNFYFGSKHD